MCVCHSTDAYGSEYPAISTFYGGRYSQGEELPKHGKEVQCSKNWNGALISYREFRGGHKVDYNQRYNILKHSSKEHQMFPMTETHERYILNSDLEGGFY